MNTFSGVVRLARPLDFSAANTVAITIIAEVIDKAQVSRSLEALS